MTLKAFGLALAPSPRVIYPPNPLKALIPILPILAAEVLVAIGNEISTGVMVWREKRM